MVPLGTEASFSRATIFKQFGQSISDVVPVANVTDRAQVVTDLTADGRGPTTTRPLVVIRADAPGLHRIEYTFDGSVWVPASGVLQFASLALANSWSTANPGLLTAGDYAVIGGSTYRWAGAWYPPTPTIDLISNTTITSTSSFNVNCWYAPGSGGSVADAGFAYDSSSGDITCQRAGRYGIDARVAIQPATSARIQFYLIRNSSPTDILAQDSIVTTTDVTTAKLSVFSIALSAGDRLRVWVPSATAGLTVGGNSRANGEFSVRFLG